MAECYVSAEDFKTHFTPTTCPACGWTSLQIMDFFLFYCPSTPDRCAGCEIDEKRLECPTCWHVWESAAPPEPTA